MIQPVDGLMDTIFREGAAKIAVYVVKREDKHTQSDWHSLESRKRRECRRLAASTNTILYSTANARAILLNRLNSIATSTLIVNKYY